MIDEFLTQGLGLKGESLTEAKIAINKIAEINFAQSLLELMEEKYEGDLKDLGIGEMDEEAQKQELQKLVTELATKEEIKKLEGLAMQQALKEFSEKILEKRKSD